jgi:hypothetical protein
MQNVGPCRSEGGPGPSARPAPPRWPPKDGPRRSAVQGSNLPPQGSLVAVVAGRGQLFGLRPAGIPRAGGRAGRRGRRSALRMELIGSMRTIARGPG